MNHQRMFNILFHLPVPEIDAVHETPHKNLNLYGKNEDPIMDVKTLTLMQCQ
jgi:hypothetical protein